jgi:hypothetical protein
VCKGRKGQGIEWGIIFPFQGLLPVFFFCPYPFYILVSTSANKGTTKDVLKRTSTEKVELFLQKLASPLHHFRASMDPQI